MHEDSYLDSYWEDLNEPWESAFLTDFDDEERETEIPFWKDLNDGDFYDEEE